MSTGRPSCAISAADLTAVALASSYRAPWSCPRRKCESAATSAGAIAPMWPESDAASLVMASDCWAGIASSAAIATAAVHAGARRRRATVTTPTPSVPATAGAKASR
jgi:hypothetical protein